MAVDKLVDSSQLDTDLTSVANAIRTKGGTSATLSFPSEFITAIEAISTGGVTVTDTVDSHGGLIRKIDTSGSVSMLQTKTNIVPTTSSQTISPDTGYDALSSVQVVGDANLIPENIKKDVTLFNVTGTCEGGGGSDDEFLGTNFTSYINSTASVIGVGKFAYQISLALVSFQNCTEIGSSAFTSCTALTMASFPSCTSIGDYAFSFCYSLSTISFPLCETIGSYAFYMNKLLTIVSFPSCTVLGEEAFGYCSSLTTVIFPKCTEVPRYGFTNCYSLTSVSFSLCETIRPFAFFNCSNLVVADFPLCKTIYSNAFHACSFLSTISFPSCTLIGSYAFQSCFSLTTASFPSCSVISGYAFNSCVALTMASFTSLLKCTIRSSAFKDCYNLISLYLLSPSMAELTNSNAFTSTPIGGYTNSTGGVYGSIYVPSSLLASYKASTNWTYFSDRIVGVNL